MGGGGWTADYFSLSKQNQPFHINRIIIHKKCSSNGIQISVSTVIEEDIFKKHSHAQEQSYRKILYFPLRLIIIMQNCVL